MKIILVSNSASLLGKGLGPQIDSFDIVVRFNNFTLEGYETDVGSKTNWVCYRACDDVKLIRPNLVDRVFSFITYCKWSAGMKHVARQQSAYYGAKSTVIDEIDCFEMARTIGYKNDLNTWPSVGILAVEYLYKAAPNGIMTCGFSWDGGGHYFPKQPNDSCRHNWSLEKSFLNSLKIPSLT